MVLGIGMAVTTQFFTMFEALTSRSLPIDAPERVVHISTRDARARPAGVSYADFEDTRDAATSFGALAAYESTPADVAEDDRAPARLQRVFISAGRPAPARRGARPRPGLPGRRTSSAARRRSSCSPGTSGGTGTAATGPSSAGRSGSTASRRK